MQTIRLTRPRRALFGLARRVLGAPPGRLAPELVDACCWWLPRLPVRPDPLLALLRRLLLILLWRRIRPASRLRSTSEIHWGRLRALDFYRDPLRRCWRWRVH